MPSPSVLNLCSFSGTTSCMFSSVYNANCACSCDQISSSVAALALSTLWMPPAPPRPVLNCLLADTETDIDSDTEPPPSPRLLTLRAAHARTSTSSITDVELVRLAHLQLVDLLYRLQSRVASAAVHLGIQIGVVKHQTFHGFRRTLLQSALLRHMRVRGFVGRADEALRTHEVHRGRLHPRGQGSSLLLLPQLLVRLSGITTPRPPSRTSRRSQCC